MTKTTIEEETRCFEKYKQTNNMNDLELVFRSLESQAKVLSTKVFVHNYSVEDLRQEVYLVAIKSIQPFINSEWYGKIKFASYTQIRAEYRLHELIRRTTTVRSGHKSIDFACHNPDQETSLDYVAWFDYSILDTEKIFSSCKNEYDKELLYNYYILGYTHTEMVPLMGASSDDSIRLKGRYVLKTITKKLRISDEPQFDGFSSRKQLDLRTKTAVVKMVKQGSRSIRAIGRLFNLCPGRIKSIVKELEVNDN
jgi:DNA-directed RNA polymerase specialized sigma24 family protein